MDASQIPSPIPFHVARAYGVNHPARAERPGPTLPAGVGAARLNVQDKVELTSDSAAARAMRDRVSGLVAGKVEQGVDFVAAGVTSAPGAIPMYRHPAEKHAAATAVDLGRGLDVRA